MKLLVASDSDVIRSRIIKMIYKQSNLKIADFGKDITDVLDKISQDVFDVLILDINVPNGCATHFFPYIKHKNPESVLIFLSDFVNPVYRQKCIDAGADYILEKSTEFDRITEIINHKNNSKDKKF